MNPLKSPLLTDLYQLTMLQGYFEAGMTDTAVFELFVRKLPPARVSPGALVVLIPASGPEPTRRLREQAAAIAAPGAPVPSQYVSIPDLAAGTIARTARAQRAAVLVWPGDGRDPDVLAQIVDAVPCPVVVVG
jgi:hypothetical protein